MRPKFFYFDLGNVLLFFDHNLAFRKMSKLAGISSEQMRALVMDTNLQIEYETGRITGLQFVSKISDAIGRELDAYDMLNAAADMFVPNPQILPVLNRVKAMGIPMGLLSNTCEAHWNWINELNYPQAAGWFSPVILSYEVGSMKPDFPIYHEAQRLSGFEPNQIFFTDDRHDNIEAALKLGWNAEVFVSAERLMKTIESW